MSNAIYVAWRSGGDGDGAWGTVGLLERGPDGYRFAYTKGARTLAGFLPFPGMDRLDEVYESNALFPLFSNRLLSKSRPEYEAYLTWGGFDPSNPPDPLAILSVTEGITQTDAVEVFPCPAPDDTGRFLAKFFLHGLRHAEPDAIARANQLRPGEALRVRLEDDNPRDPKAVAIWTSDAGEEHRLGYVPRYLARDVRALCANGAGQDVRLCVERANPGAPLQMRILCRLSAPWPERFHPCAGEEFEPIVEPVQEMRGPVDARSRD